MKSKFLVVFEVGGAARLVGFLVKDMREIDYFDEMCEFSFAIQGSKQFESQNLILLGFQSVGKVFPSAG